MRVSVLLRLMQLVLKKDMQKENLYTSRCRCECECEFECGYGCRFECGCWRIDGIEWRGKTFDRIQMSPEKDALECSGKSGHCRYPILC